MQTGTASIVWRLAVRADGTFTYGNDRSQTSGHWRTRGNTVEVSDDQVLGKVGSGFAPMQNRLGVRRLEIACRALGYARREVAVPGELRLGSPDGPPVAVAALGPEWWRG